MKYRMLDGKAFEFPEKNGKVSPALVPCSLILGIGIGLFLIAESHPHLVVKIMSACSGIAVAVWHAVCEKLTDVGMAIWQMIRDIADALSMK